MSPTPNPDRRPLPPGWIEQWNDQYNAWFYVDTRRNPPVSSWTHPDGPPPPPGPPPGAYAPPPGGPPARDNYGGGYSHDYNRGSSPYPPQGGQDPYRRGPSPGWGGSPAPAYGGGYGGSPGPGYGGGAPGPGYAPGYYQGAPQGDTRGFFSHSPQPPPQTVVYEQAPPKKSGFGTGGMLAAGGAGLLGGVLLGEALDGGDGGGDGGDDGGGDGGGWGGDDGGGDGGGDW